MTPPAKEVTEETQEPETNGEVDVDSSEARGSGEQQSVESHQHNHSKHNQNHRQFSRQSEGIQKFQNRNKQKTTFKRIDVDPTRRYHTPEARESWGPNVKGKKFRKEKGKKKRSTGTGARIDGSVRSVRLS